MFSVLFHFVYSPNLLLLRYVGIQISETEMHQVDEEVVKWTEISSAMGHRDAVFIQRCVNAKNTTKCQLFSGHLSKDLIWMQYFHTVIGKKKQQQLKAKKLVCIVV